MGSRRSTCRLTAITPSPRRVLTPFESYRDLRRLLEGGAASAERLAPVAQCSVAELGVAVRLIGLDDRRKRRHRLVVAAKPHHDHTLGRAAESLDLLDRDSDHGARGRDQHDLVAVADDARTDEVAARLGQLHGLDSHAATSLGRILGDARPLAVAVL